MNFLPDSITRLITELSKLPGIGPKSAQRLTFHLLKAPEAQVLGLSEAVGNVRKGVVTCSVCFSLTTENPCKICSHPGRDKSLLCIVETTLDLLAIERTGEYRGLYHVLQGKISPLDGVGPEQLRIAELFARLTEQSSTTKEVILALNPDLEGETTSLFLHQKLLNLRPMLVSRLARGLPSGGNLEYTDETTLIRALQGRQVMR